MEVFIKATAGILVALVLCIVLVKYGKDFSLLVSLAVCCMVIGVAYVFLQPVISFIEQLVSIGNLDFSMIQILLKAAGIGLISQIVGLICNDSGNSAMGKSLELLATAAILWLTIPLLSELINLVENILNEL